MARPTFRPTTLPISLADGRLWQIDERSGDQFDVDRDYQGFVLTIQIRTLTEARAIALSIMQQNAAQTLTEPSK